MNEPNTTKLRRRVWLLEPPALSAATSLSAWSGAVNAPLPCQGPRGMDRIDWFLGDLEKPEAFKFPPFTTLFCTASAALLSSALPYLLNPSLKRIVVFTSTSVLTKIDSEIASERATLTRLAEAERNIESICSRAGIEWTILRPTLIYAEGRDGNITPLSRLIRRFGFMPLVGGAQGLRQPVHAEDLAIGAISAASTSAAANKIYSLPGGETLTYREMIGRIFDGLRLPRRTLSIPPVLVAGRIRRSPSRCSQAPTPQWASG